MAIIVQAVTYKDRDTIEPGVTAAVAAAGNGMSLPPTVVGDTGGYSDTYSNTYVGDPNSTVTAVKAAGTGAAGTPTVDSYSNTYSNTY